MALIQGGEHVEAGERRDMLRAMVATMRPYSTAVVPELVWPCNPSATLWHAGDPSGAGHRLRPTASLGAASWLRTKETLSL